MRAASGDVAREHAAEVSSTSGVPPGDAGRKYEDTLLLVLTLVIGTVVGLVVVAFILVTEGLGDRLFASGQPSWYRLAIPVAGALTGGALLAALFPDARGSGIPQTKTALVLGRGFISLRTVVGKFTCSSIALSSGIALGREGPTVHIGAGVASVLGRRFGLDPHRVRELVPVGTAAALAAAFNTPISAVLFTLEEILGDLHAPVLGSIVISSATSWAVLRLVLGDEPLFHVPAYQLVHPLELLAYALLGVVGGLVSVGFVKLLLWLRAAFLRLPARTKWAQPLAGGLAVGVLGWMVPEVLGVGYQHVGRALNGEFLLGGMVVLLSLKILATASCYASGNAGGIFGPSLFIGAMLGGSVGSTAHWVAPEAAGSPGAYALVGMGTAFAGIIRAPMTSVIMIFEITRDYSIIVPLMIANLLSYFISQRLQPSAVYEALLHQDGVTLPAPRMAAGGLTIEQVMDASPEIAAGSTTVADAASRLISSGTHARCAWPVVEDGRLGGMVTAEHLRLALADGRATLRLGDLVRDWATTPAVPPVHGDEPVEAALLRMGGAGVDVLPVVSRADPRLLLGTLRLADLPAACDRAYAADRRPPRDGARPPSPRAWLTVVVAGLCGLFLLGVVLTQHYYSGRSETVARHVRTGEELVRQQRFADASEQFRAALSLAGADEYRLALGLALARAGRGAEASTYLAEVLRRDPANGPANLATARIAAGDGRTDEAIASYRAAIGGTWAARESGDRVEATFELAAVLQGSGRTRQAVAELVQLGTVQTDPGILERVARRLLALDASHEAAETFRVLAQTRPRYAAAYTGLGDAELAQRDYRAARRAFARALELDANDPRARVGLALSDRVQALDPTVRGLRTSERYARSRDLLAAVLAAIGACATVDAEGETAALVDQARRFSAASHRAAARADATDEGIRLAVELWTRRSGACPARPEDEAVDRVIALLRGHP